MMKKIVIMFALAMASLGTWAGTFLVSVQMADGSIITFELPSVPNPDSNGMYRFHSKTSGDIVVHCSHVWIEEKSNRKKQKKGREEL